MMPVSKVKRVMLKSITVGTLLFFVGAIVLPTEAVAGRSAAGGGHKSEINIGDFALAVGMQLGQCVVGGAINSALGAGAGAFGSGSFSSIPGAMGSGFIDKISNVFGSSAGFTDTMATGFATFTATSEISRALAMTAQAHNWDKQTLFIANAVGTSMAAGMINPAGALGNTLGSDTGSVLNVLRGGFTGALGGLGDAGLQMAIDPKSLDENRSPNVSAQIAGMAGGLFATNLGRALVNPANYTSSYISSGGRNAPVAFANPGPDAKTIAARLTIGPVVDTLNDWPLLASRAAGMYVSEQFHEPWRQPVNAAISSFLAPALSAAANAYALTPSLFSDVDKDVLARSTGVDMQRARNYALNANDNKGSPTALMKDVMTQWAKYQLPESLISGGIQSGLSAMVKDKSMAKQMLLSVGSVVGTGIARGLVWYAYNQNTYGDTAASSDPRKLTAGTSTFGDSARAMDPATAIAMSVGQSLMESGAQSFSMGLPNVPGDVKTGRGQGELGAFAWNSYARNLASSSRVAASGRIGLVMTSNVVSAASDVTERNVMTALADTPIGTMMGAQAFVPLKGYKGDPVSVGMVRDRTAAEGTGEPILLRTISLPYRRLDIATENTSFGEVIKGVQTSTQGAPSYNNGSNPRLIQPKSIE